MRKAFVIVAILFIKGTIAQCVIDLPNGSLYIDAQNKIRVFNNGSLMKPNDYLVELNSGDYIKTDSCLWLIPNGDKQIVTIKNKKGNTLLTKSFRAMLLPDPKIFGDGAMGGGLVQKEDLINISGFVPELSFAYPNPYKIVSFGATLFLGNETRFFKCVGPLISDSLRYYMKKMRDFDHVDFDYFLLSPYYLHIFGPEEFLVQHSARVIFNYEALISDTLVELEQKPFIDTWALMAHYDTLVRFTETNCSSLSDTCFLNIFYLIDGKKQLTFSYQYFSNDTFKEIWFNKGILLAEINYWKDLPCGPFTIYDTTGSKIEQGNYTIVNTPWADTVTRINPISLNEELRYFHHDKQFRDGEWTIYHNGDIVRKVRYKDGELIESR